MKLKASERIRIREYVRGIMAGVSCRPVELTNIVDDTLDDSWFMFAHNRTLHLCLDDDGYWQCAVYNVRHGHVDVKDWVALDLEGL